MNNIKFNFSKCPNIIFGPGKINELGKIAQKYGSKILLVTGSNSLKKSNKFDKLINIIKKASMEYFHFSISGEPSPDIVDKAVNKYKSENISVVAAVGGGSVIDAGKAISAMLLMDSSVTDFLEGVGKGLIHPGIKVPFIAIPTTSGTGSEATKNAVLSRVSRNGFKKSLRHENFIPDIALIDPELMISCPSNITAACGMDTLSQIFGAYMSTKASLMTDALAEKGFECVGKNLIKACTNGGNDIKTRANMAFSSLISGLILANAGLGIVHGIAGPLGGFFNIPHGVACGILLAPSIEMNISKLKADNIHTNQILKKYAKASVLLLGNDKNNINKNCTQLIDLLYKWSVKLKLPLLNKYNIKKDDIDFICDAGSIKNNPVALSKSDIKKLLLQNIGSGAAV